MSDLQSGQLDISNFRDLRYDLIPAEGLDIYGDIVGILFPVQSSKEYLGKLHFNVIEYPKVYSELNGDITKYQLFGVLRQEDVIISGISISPAYIYAYVSEGQSNQYVFISVFKQKFYIVAAYSMVEEGRFSTLSCTPATEMKKLFQEYLKVIPGKLNRIFWRQPSN